MKPKMVKAGEVKNLPDGTVLQHRNQLFFKSPGLDAPIVTRSTDGMWFFLSDLKRLGRKNLKVVYQP